MASAGVVVTRVLEEGVLAPDGFHSRALHRSQGSILIYLAVGGTVVPMRVLESDSIASVKLRIQSCKGFVVKKQKLVFEGRELARNDCLVKDYGVADGNVLHLVLRLSDLRFITVKTDCGKVFEFHVEKSRSVGYVKQQVAKRGRGFLDHGAQALTCDGEELDDQKRIDDICRDNDAVIRLLVKKTAKVRAWPVEKEFEVSIEAPGEVVGGRAEVDVGRLSLGEENHLVGKNVVDLEACLEPVKVNDKIELSNVAKDFIHSAAAGLQGKHFPVRSSEGSGGAYFMRDASGLSFVGVFKPTDEEPMAVNNPQGLPLSEDGEGLKRGTKVGEGALREVAAYILDHPVGGPRACSGDEVGFSGVPPTVMVKCLHEGFYHPDGFDCSVENAKMGSLQMFVKNQGSCEDMGPRDFPVGEVHKIAVLDMRLANADRHAGNILFSKGADGRIELIPIDHGYCLPESFEDCTFDWLNWPQACVPFSATTLEYIKTLDAEQDISLLKFHGWDVPLKCVRTLRISTMLLKKGAGRGLAPFSIGSMMSRESLTKESIIEEIIMEAEGAVLPGVDEAAFLESISEIMDRRLDELTE